MPLLEEEQVLMCRLMRDRLIPGQSVLDVGTGSGVLGIWAARHGCRVWAIDISARASQFARKNATQNGIRLARSPNRLADGEMYIEKVSVEEFALRERTAEGRYDIVILNPPFNPTCPGMNVAIHASAGILGQKPFRRQVTLAAALQRKGGYCVGFQMSHDRSVDDVGVCRHIRNAYSGCCDVEYAHVLADVRQMPVDAFLRWQYSQLFMRNKITSKGSSAKGPAPSIQAYIRRAERIGGYFSLVYYEVKKTSDVAGRPPRERVISGKPIATWEDRAWLHRCIVEHTDRIASPLIGDKSPDLARRNLVRRHGKTGGAWAVED